jgi:hypothetical protein
MSDENAIHALKFARLGAAYAIELAKGDTSAAIATDEPGAPDRWVLFAGLFALAFAARQRAKNSAMTVA